MARRYVLNRRLLDNIIAQQKADEAAASRPQLAALTNPMGNTSGYDSSFHSTAWDSDDGPSIGSRVLDVVSRPAYAIKNLIKDTIDPNEGTDNPLESLWAGLSGVDKTMGSDVIQKMDDVYFDTQDVPDWVKGIGGFVGDVAFDPLTYIPVSWGVNALKGLKKGSEALAGGAEYAAKAKAGEGLTEFNPAEIANRGGTTPGVATKSGKKAAEEAEAAAAAQQNAVRREAVGETVVGEVKTDPIDTARVLDEAKPAANKVKPIVIKDNLDPVTHSSVLDTFAENMKIPGAYTRQEAAREAALSVARSKGDADDIYRTVFKDDEVLGPQIMKEVTESRPLPPATPKSPTVTVPTPGPVPPVTVPKPVPAVSNSAKKVGDPLVANDYAMAATTAEITRALSAEAKKAGLTGGSRQEFMRNGLLTRLHESKAVDMAAGVYPTVKLGDNMYNLHPADVLDAIGKDINRLHLGYDTVPTSSLLQGAARTIQAKTTMSGDELLTAVKESIYKGHRTMSTISDRRATVAAKSLIKNAETLEKKLLDNEMEIGKRDVVTGAALGKETAEATKAVVDNPLVGAGDTLKAVADVKGTVIRNGRDKGLSPGGIAVGARTADDGLKGTIAAGDEAGARATVGAAKDSGKGNAAKAKSRQVEQAKKDAAEVDEIIDKTPNWVDIGEKVDINLQKGVARLYSGLLGGMVHGFRQGIASDLYRTAKGTVETFTQQYNDMLGQVLKTHGEVNVQEAGNALLAGVKIGKRDDEVARAMRDLKPLMDHVFDPDGGLAGNILTRQGHMEDTIQHVMKAKGLESFQVTKTKNGVAGEHTIGDMRAWNVKDWPDFLSKMQSVAMELSTRQGVANDFARLAGSKTPKPGWVRIARTDYDKAPMSHFIPEGYYFPREDATLFANFSRQLDSKVAWTGDGMGSKFVRNVVQRYQRLWKPTVTLLRPGHHVRNFIGDGAMNFMAGVSNPKHYRNALKAMKSTGNFKGDLAEMTKLLKGEATSGTLGSQKALTAKLGSGAQDLSHAQLHAVAYRNGILTSFRSSEDLAKATEGAKGIGGAVDKLTEGVMGSKVGRAAGALSENSTHFHKLAQLSHMLSDVKFTRQFDNIDDAAKAAAKEISKWHPDVTGLAKGEAKYGRVAFNFYTWMRQAIPTILASTLTRPGRAVMYPKATYAFQQSIGMEPKSFSEPFSGVNALPSFMKDSISGNIGPDGGTFGYNLGTPMETLQDYFSAGQETNPLKALGGNVLGDVNPLLTLLPELAQQKEVSGKFISDPSENLDQAIPFLNQLSALSGVSATGSLGNLFGTQAGPILDPQRAVEKGEKDYFLNTNLINFLTGLGIQPANRPSYTNIALKENRG